MNNFDGQLKLYPEVCIDNFSSEVLFNLRIRCYILTHFHDDHMKNLEDLNFYRILKENNGTTKFYCSTITKKFIQTCDKYQHLTEFCQEITSESPFIVNISQKETVTVTFCGSGHCPGSVMVFIEGLRGNVLFTGDFRLPLGCASRLKFFKENNVASEVAIKTNQTNGQKTEEKSKKNLENLYIDMTFFKPEIKYIPTREESVETLITFIKNFVKQKDKIQCLDKEYFSNYIYMKTSARIGYEYVYQEIHRSTGFKIHVNDLIYKIYDQLPAIQSSLTQNPYETPIHACIYENKKRDLAKTDLMTSSLQNNSSSSSPTKMRKSYFSTTDLYNENYKPNLPCCIHLNSSGTFKVNCVKVILSAMWFTDTAGVDKIFVGYNPSKKEKETMAYKPYDAIYRLLYSFHSSFEEIVDFVNYLKPNKLHSIALPDSTNEKIINEYFYDLNTKTFQGFQNNRVKSMLKNSSSESHLCVSTNKIANNGKLLLRKRTFDSLSVLMNEKSSSDESSTNSENELDFGDDDSGKVLKIGPKKRLRGD